MKRAIFAVFDAKAAAFLDPIVTHNEATAVRMFGSAVADPRHDFGRFPEDYTLFHVGSFDSESGVIESAGGPRSVVLGSVLKASQEDK